MLFGLQRWQLNEFAITPGQATDVPPLVSVQQLDTTNRPAKILLVDVYLQQLSMLQYLTFHLLKHVEFIPGSYLESPGVPTSELTAQGYQQMLDSKTYAEVAALRALGWHVAGHPVGAVITQVGSGSPADRAGLMVEDRVVAANGQAIATSCSLYGVVHTMRPGTTLRLTVVHQSFTATGTLRVGRTSLVTLRTAPAPTDLGPSGCPGQSGVDTSYIGVGLEDGVHYDLPGKISVNTANIGGPSAGLAMTLAIIDTLSSGSLTGGHVIATTGTISPNGAVGAVGGVREKTVAVENAGARYFFVPASEAAQARQEATPGLHVVPVTSLGQVLAYLQSIGGTPIHSITPPTKP